MQENKIIQSEQNQKLTRNQMLQYIAEMSEEMSKLAAAVDCADLAHSLKAASEKAQNLLPTEYKD